jgi:tetratricopeptide (TPR) repeat protein
MTSKLPPQEIEHLFAAGWAALQNEKLGEAEEAFLGVLASDPGHADALNGLATVCFHERRLDEAEKTYQRAEKAALKFFKKRPDHFDWQAPHDRSYLRALHGQALTAYRRGETQEAERRFRELLKLNPADNTGARFMLDDIRKGRKKWDSRDPHDKKKP